jgi:hypothetical protein
MLMKKIKLYKNKINLKLKKMINQDQQHIL